jgi:hypothetical protein
MLKLTEPYAPRPIRFLGLWENAGWRMKVYGIAYRRSLPRADLIEAAQTIALGCLPQPAITDQRYGVGFIGIHDGRGASFVFIDWFADENELHHHVFIGPPGSDGCTETCHARSGDCLRLGFAGDDVRAAGVARCSIDESARTGP